MIKQLKRIYDKIRISFLTDEEKKDEIAKKSNEPWVKIVGSSIDPERGIKIDLDWNDAFIENLRKNGFTGVSDEKIIQQWIALLYKDIVESMADKNSGDFT